MEEQFMFTRIHDALDIPTPPGAYERLRAQLTKKPVRPSRWPALQMRTSTMGFRLAAGLVVVAIAVAAAAAAVAIHNSTNNVAPAGPRMSIQAYQKMIARDSPDPNTVWSAPCDYVQHSGCESDATRSIPLIQKWYDDVSSASPPVQFAAVNQDMRQHLAQNISALHALLSDSHAHDAAAMTRDFDVAVYAVYWTSQVVPAIEASQQVDYARYLALVSSEKRTLDDCGASCGFGGSADRCTTGASAMTCLDFFDSGIGPHFDGLEADLTKEIAPSSLTDKGLRLQSDVLQAEAVLITLRFAVAANDQAGVSVQIKKLETIKTQIDVDAAKITG